LGGNIHILTYKKETGGVRQCEGANLHILKVRKGIGEKWVAKVSKKKGGLREGRTSVICGYLGGGLNAK